MTKRASWVLAGWVLGVAGVVTAQVGGGQGVGGEAVKVASLVRVAEAGVQEDAGFILARADLGEADRQKLGEILKRAHAAAEKMAGEAGDKMVDQQGDQVAERRRLLTFVEPVTKEYESFVKPRPDLDWMRARAAAIVVVEEKMLRVRTGDYMNVVRDAGIAGEKAEAIAGVLEKCRGELETLRKLSLAATALAADEAGKRTVAREAQAKESAMLSAARGEVRKKLTAGEVVFLEWQFLREYRDIPTYETLGYSTQGQVWAVPEDGAYVLEEFPGRKVIGTSTLKRGAVMGFAKKDGVLKAVAGEKEFAVAAGAVVYWKWAAGEGE